MIARLACISCIALGWIVAAVMVTINFRYGQKNVVDVDGFWLQGTMLLALSIGPTMAASIAGMWWNSDARRWAIVACAICVPLTVFSVWNSSHFMVDQTQGKIQASERTYDLASQLAETQNSYTLKERDGMRKQLEHILATAKSKDVRDDAFIKLQALTDKPIDLKAAWEVAPAPSTGKSLLLARWFGWDKETIQGITPSIGPILAAIVEIFFPMMGFAQWPKTVTRDHLKDRPPKPIGPEEFTRIERKFTKAEAREDVRAMIAQGKSFKSNQDASWHWGVAASTASTWLKDFRKEGLEFSRVRNGKEKAVMPRIVNGNGAAAHAA